MKPAFFALIVGGASLAACQAFVGIGSREEGTPEPLPSSLPTGTPADGSLDSGGPLEAGEATSPSATCGLGLVRCGTSCVDLRTESSHCGECGHDCLGAKCLARLCEPELVTPEAGGTAVHVANGELFYRLGNDDVPSASLVARDLTTNVVRSVLEVGVYYSMRPLTGTRWLLIDHTASAARIRVVDLATGSIEQTVYNGPRSPEIRGAMARGDDVFFTTRSDVRHVKLDGSGLEVVKTVASGIEGDFGATPALDVTDTLVYFGITDRGVLHELPRVTKASSRVIDRASTDATYLSAGPDSITWLSGSQVREVPLDGAPPAVFQSGVIAPHTTFRAGSSLYITDNRFIVNARQSRIVRFDLASRQPFELANNQAPFGQIAVDDRFVYMPFYTGGIWRVAR